MTQPPQPPVSSHMTITIERDLVDPDNPEAIVDQLARRLVGQQPKHPGARKALEEALKRKAKPGVSRSDVIRAACAMLKEDLDG